MTCDHPLPVKELAATLDITPDQLHFLWARSLRLPDFWEIAGIGTRSTCELRSGNPMFRNAETLILPATETPLLETTE